MTNSIITLRLKEELEPINGRLGAIEGRLDCVEAEMKQLKEGQALLKKEIIDSISTYTAKLESCGDNKTEVLNKRAFAVETEIQRLARTL